MFDTPMIRLEIDHMRHQILHAFSTHVDNLKDKIQCAVDRAIERFDFGNEVARLVDGMVKDTIKNTLERASWQVTSDEAIKKTIADALIKSIKENQ